MMEKHFISHFWIESLSALCILFPIGEKIIYSGGPADFMSILLSLFSACAVMLMLPISDENAVHSLCPAILITLLCVLFSIFGFDCHVTVILVFLIVFVYLIARAFGRYLFIRPLFRQLAVWQAIENHARHMYCLGLFMLGGLLLLADSLESPVWLVMLEFVLLLFEYALLIVRAHTGKTFFICRRKEEHIKDIARGNLRTVPDQQRGGDDDARMHILYEKVVAVMESRQPFLNENFSLQNLASEVFTNKTYLSRTINVISGRNFCQFVNYYRVQYAVEMMRKEPRLRMSELSSMSGFHSVVTFNMAFKLYMNVTPSEYSQKLKMELS